MLILKLDSFPVEQVPDAAQFEQGLGGYVADLPFPVRLLAYSRPFAIAPAIARLAAEINDILPLALASNGLLRAVRSLVEQEPGEPHPAEVVQELAPEPLALLQAVLGGVPAFAAALDTPWLASETAWKALATSLSSILWPLPWLKEQRRFYEELARSQLRSAEYYLVAWPPKGVSADSLVAGLSRATERPVTEISELPAVLRGRYRVDEQRARFVPERPAHPHLAILHAYEANGIWDIGLLHRLMAGSEDVAIAIDIQALTHGRTSFELGVARDAAVAALGRHQSRDPRAERVLGDVDRAISEIGSGRQALHYVHLAVLVSGESAAQLETNVTNVRDVLGLSMRLDRLAGVQGELIKLWSTVQLSQIDAPINRVRLPVLSDGVGCLLGVLGYHRSGRTDGILWGIDALRRAPLFYDLFANNQAAHMVVLGKTGFGKTFFLNTIALRAAALGYRVIMIDAFSNAARMEAAAGAGVSANWITLSSAINILDLAFDPTIEADWIASQVAYVTSQLALLMGTPGVDALGRRCYVPRQFDYGERGVLDLALTTLYERWGAPASVEDSPRLSDLIAVLDELHAAEAEAGGGPKAQLLADDLCEIIYGTARRDADRLNKRGQQLNATSTIDWSFSADISCFDFSAVTKDAPELLAFYYAQAVGSVNRFMRDPARDRNRKTLLIIDEFGFAAQVEAVGRLAGDLAKVARKYAIGVLAVDQNPATFLGSQVGREIIEGAVAKILFHLDDLAAQQMAEAMSVLTPEFVRYLTTARVGECVAVFNNDVYMMRAEPNGYELQALRGS